MITFTKEQLIASAHARIEFAEMMLNGELEPLKERTWSIELELACIALASVEADPVAYVDPVAFHNFSAYRSGKTDNKHMGREWMWANPDAGLIPVYTAPISPMVPYEIPLGLTSQIINLISSDLRDHNLTQRIWNACRAAMLADKSPVTPDGYVLVPIEPTEDMIVNGFESAPHEGFCAREVWEEYQSMSGCRQAAHRAKLCWAAMIAAAPQQEASND